MIQGNDQFCGFCGCKIFDCDVRLQSNNQLLYADQKAQILRVEIQNKGSLPIEFSPIFIQSNKKDVQSPESNKRFTVKPAIPHIVDVRVDPRDFPLKLGRIFVSPLNEQDAEIQSLPVKLV